MVLGFCRKNIDLVCIDKDFGIIIVELDGAVHDLKVQKTLDRNSLYIEALSGGFGILLPSQIDAVMVVKL